MHSLSLLCLPPLLTNNSRKGLGDQVQEKVTPDSQKSTLDKASETASGAYDRAAGAVQPRMFPSSSPSIVLVLTASFRGRQVHHPEAR
jgi:hypothetical protein